MSTTLHPTAVVRGWAEGRLLPPRRIRRGHAGRLAPHFANVRPAKVRTCDIVPGGSLDSPRACFRHPSWGGRMDAGWTLASGRVSRTRRLAPRLDACDDTSATVRYLTRPSSVMP